MPQCLHCHISGRDAIVNWKCKPRSRGSRSAGTGAHSLLVPVSIPAQTKGTSEGPNAQLWIMDMPARTKIYPMQLAMGRNLFCIYKQAKNACNAVVESLSLLLILCTSAWQKAWSTLRLYGLFGVYLQNKESKCQRIYDQNTWYLQSEDWSERPCVCTWNPLTPPGQHLYEFFSSHPIGICMADEDIFAQSNLKSWFQSVA